MCLCLFTVFFYNFGMPDFGVSSLVGLLDAVKVLAFAVKEGKVAVHCHAGLGRTGGNHLLFIHTCFISCTFDSTRHIQYVSLCVSFFMFLV